MKLEILVLYVILNVLCCSGKKNKLSEEEIQQKCKACTEILTHMKDNHEKVIEKKNINGFRTALNELCKTYKVNSAHEKFCYNVGALEHSPVSILSDVLSDLYFLDADKKCMRLFEKNPEVCAAKMPVNIDWANINLKKMSISKLIKLLNQLGGDCTGCTEKSDYVKAVESFRPETNTQPEL